MITYYRLGLPITAAFPCKLLECITPVFKSISYSFQIQTIQWHHCYVQNATLVVMLSTDF